MNRRPGSDDDWSCDEVARPLPPLSESELNIFPPEQVDPAIEAKQNAIERIVTAAINCAGSFGEKWAMRYAHLNWTEADLFVKAIETLKQRIDAGQEVMPSRYGTRVLQIADELRRTTFVSTPRPPRVTSPSQAAINTREERDRKLAEQRAAQAERAKQDPEVQAMIRKLMDAQESRVESRRERRA